MDLKPDTLPDVRSGVPRELPRIGVERARGVRACPMRPATMFAGSVWRPAHLQRSQLAVCRSRFSYQSLLAFRTEKLQGFPAVRLQGGRQGLAVGVVVQPPESFLRFTQILQRSPLPRESFAGKQVFEEFD